MPHGVLEPGGGLCVGDGAPGNRRGRAKADELQAVQSETGGFPDCGQAPAPVQEPRKRCSRGGLVLGEHASPISGGARGGAGSQELRNGRGSLAPSAEDQGVDAVHIPRPCITLLTSEKRIYEYWIEKSITVLCRKFNLPKHIPAKLGQS